MKARRRIFITATIIGAPLLFLSILEVILALVGYGTTYEYEDPFLGFSNTVSLFQKQTESGTSFYRTRASKLQWFNDEEFLARKRENEYRIFCFGGSTTYGRPYYGVTAFPHWMEVFLQAEDPVTRYKVINVGGVSYASYRIVNLMTEMVNYEPDLFVVFTGHNEFLEDRTYAELLEEPSLLTSIRAQLNHLRTYALARSLWLGRGGKSEAETKFEMTGEVSPMLDRSFGLDRYHREDRKSKAIVAHFETNLSRMIDIAADHGVDILFVVPASNEKDFSPFKSEFSRTLSPEESQVWNELYASGMADLGHGNGPGALAAFEQVTALDSEYADARFRTGKALLLVGEANRAKSEFVRARDADIAPLRATSEIQNTVRRVTAQREIPRFDLERFLEQSQMEQLGYTALGNEFFFDHCHPTIEVHRMIAENLVELAKQSVPALISRNWRSADRKALYDSVMATVDPVYHGMRDLNLAKVLRWAGKKEEAIPFVERAASELPDHPEAQYLYGLEQEEKGNLPGAAASFELAIKLDSANPNPYNALGSLHMRTNNLQKAVGLFRKATEVDPSHEGAQYNLGNALYRSGKAEEAIQAFQEALRIDPNHTMAMNNLGVVYLQRRELDLAVPLFEKTLSLDPENIEAYSNLGVIAFLRGSPEESKLMFERVLRLSPKDAYALEWLDRISKTPRKPEPQ